MKFLGTTALASVILGASPVLALDFGPGLTLTGEIELEYLTANSYDETFGYLDLTLGWRSQSGGGLGFGVDVNPVYYYDISSGQSYDRIWGGLVLSTGLGEVTVGSPRPLLATMIQSPEIGGIRLFDLELEAYNGSILETITLQSQVDVLGVSFKGTSGALSYGASYYTLGVGGPDASAVELAFAYQAGKTRIQGGLELLDSPDNLEKMVIGATHIEDRWSAGILATQFSAGSEDFTSFKLFGDYKVTEAFTLGAQVLALQGFGSNDTLYGITGEYGLASGGFAQLGAVHFVGEADPVYSASIGWRF